MAYSCCVGTHNGVYIDLDIEVVGKWGSGVGTKREE